MRILYLITKSEPGGAQTHIFQMSRYMIEKSNDVAVMGYQGGWLEEKIKNLGGKFYPNKFLSNSFNILKGLRAMKEIKKALEDFKPDLVSCHSTAAGFWGRLALRQAQGKPSVIFTAHGWGFTPGAPFWRKIVILAEKIASPYCQKIICVSDFDKNLALKYKITSKDKLITIHNGVEINEIQNSKFKIQNYPEQIPSELYGADNSRLKIIFIGRLTEPKDPLLLLRAFNELPQELKAKSEVLIIGEGEKRKKLENFVNKNKLKEKVKFLGGLPREKIFEILKESHIFVLTSNYEGFPRTILEAMSFGLAIVASDVGGVREAIDESCGILVKRGDKERIKEVLERLLKNPEIISILGQNANRKIREKFSLEKMLKETEKIYQEI